MKQILTIIAIMCCISAQAQNAATIAATPSYILPTTNIGGGRTPNPVLASYYNTTQAAWDTTGWYVQCVKPITIYTYSVTPLNVLSAPPGSLCVVQSDTAVYMKILTSDSANWYKLKATATGTN